MTKMVKDGDNDDTDQRSCCTIVSHEQWTEICGD